MKREITVEMFAEESNFVVLKVPGRQHPGVVVQGGSLSGILGNLREAIDLFDANRKESLGCLNLAYDELKWRLDGYQRICDEHDMPVPSYRKTD